LKDDYWEWAKEKLKNCLFLLKSELISSLKNNPAVPAAKTGSPIINCDEDELIY